MSISLNVDVKNENEFNQQLQLYLAQGYNMQSNYNGTAILKKKSYSTGLLIVLIIVFFPAAILYYLVASDDVVTITNTNVNPAGNDEFEYYCENCGHGLFKDSKFCPGCGEKTSPIPEENVLTCENCGKTLSEDVKFCPECGEELTKLKEVDLTCGNCGKIVEKDAKFCPECGFDLSQSNGDADA